MNKLSHLLSYTLRHDPPETMNSDGYVPIKDLLELSNFKNGPNGGYTIDDVQICVNTNSKKRFTIDASGTCIRANQGHTIPVPDLELHQLIDIDTPVIHGTYIENWKSIEKNGLSCMKRNHIHFTTRLPNNGKVISGMRSDCNVFIFIDMNKAIQDGFEFFKSTNDVILCSGNKNGIIPPKYFKQVVFV